VLFTDSCSEQSCTAGRSAFLTGQSPIRTGLVKVGIPGAPVGLQAEDPTLAQMLKPLGYATGQSGKNHLGDRNKYLPTVHGFDEFFGNLYHLNAEEEPEHPDYRKNPEFSTNFGPRGVLDCKATDKQSKLVDERFGPMGKQECEDTGPLTRKRMETVDEEFLERAIQFIKKNEEAGTPWFVHFAPSRMHFYTHLKPKSAGKTGLGIYADGMVEHDGHIGQLLDLLEELGIADNTIVTWTADNGPHYNEWPDGGLSPFRGEKHTNWEGGYRTPMLVRWPAKIPGGQVVNDIAAMNDWVPTLMAAAGNPNIKEQLKKGTRLGDKKYKVHLDGYNILPNLMAPGEDIPWPRREYLYWNDEGQLAALRYDNRKLVFMEQRARGAAVWRDPFVPLRIPKLFNLRSDMYERADTDSNNYNRWWFEHAFVFIPAQAFVGNYLGSFKEFPPSQKSGSFSGDQVLEQLQTAPETGR
jgi:arylsulfatase A-like enzyme